MQLATQVTFRDIPHSDAIEAYVLKHAAKLDTFSPRITACHVVIEAPHRHQHGGRHYRVRIELTVPKGEIVASRTADEDSTNEDVYAAIDAAFDRVARRLEDRVRKLRGDVKSRTPP